MMDTNLSINDGLDFVGKELIYTYGFKEYHRNHEGTSRYYLYAGSPFRLRISNHSRTLSAEIVYSGLVSFPANKKELLRMANRFVHQFLKEIENRMEKA